MIPPDGPDSLPDPVFILVGGPGQGAIDNAASYASPDGRWRSYSYEEIIARDEVSLDLSWLRDESLEDSANLPDPHILAQEIADDLRSALAQIEDVLGDLERCASLGLEEPPA